MASYNLAKAEDRERLRADRQSELDAVEQGNWPRDINDIMRWQSASRLSNPAAWAARMCKLDLDYLAFKAGEP